MRFTSRCALSVLILAWAGSMAHAATELLGIRTTVDRQATTFLLRLPTQVEYSPTRITPRLFVVDMTGVSGEPSPQSQLVESTLVDSYRLLAYRGADDQPHLALELTLKEEGQINIDELAEGLEIRVELLSSTRAPAAAQAKVETKAPPAAPARPAPAARRTSVQEISVALAETGAGLEVEILGDGAMQYRTMELRHPDRLVVDIPDAVNRIRTRRLEVDTPPLKSVRVAQFTRQPAITRVVMDLDSKVPYEVRKQSNGLLVSLGASESAAAEQASPAPVAAALLTPAPREVEVSVAELSPDEELEPEEELEMELAEVETELEAELKNDPSESVAQAVAQAIEEPLISPFQSEDPVLVASNQPPAIPAPSTPRTTPPAAVISSPEAASLEPAAAALLPQTAEPAEPVVAQVAQAQVQPAAAASPVPVLMAQAGAPLSSQLGSGQAPVYTGEPISVNLKDVDLDDFFRLIHEISGLNIVIDPNVAGTVTIVFDEVPWDQAMDIVMRNNGLAEGERIGNVVRIASVSTLEAEANANLARAQAEAQAIEQSQPLQTVTRVLSYAQAKGLVPTLKRFLSARGDLTFDARTNMLIITDIAPAIGEVDRLLGTLDQKTQQVEIEARIVAASRSFARDIGSQLAASGQTGRVVLGGTGLVGESPVLRGDTPPLFIGAPPLPPEPGSPPIFASVAQPLLTNLAAVGPVGGMTFLLTTPTFALDAILTAAESRGLGKLLSRPKIITQNNVEAVVQQGVRIPIQTSINNTITTQFINVVLRLTVTPQITAEGTIFLRADIENTGINPGIARINGIPALNTQQATTQVLVSNGGTVFFGGVIQTENNLTEQQVPLLGSIPLVGNLFKRRATSSSTNELLFFITPRIVQS